MQTLTKTIKYSQKIDSLLRNVNKHTIIEQIKSLKWAYKQKFQLILSAPPILKFDLQFPISFEEIQTQGVTIKQNQIIFDNLYYYYEFLNDYKVKVVV